jgi:hypothetical protein
MPGWLLSSPTGLRSHATRKCGISKSAGALAAYHGHLDSLGLTRLVVTKVWSGAMTRRLRRIDWAALGADVGSAELFTLRSALALGSALTPVAARARRAAQSPADPKEYLGALALQSLA